MLKLDQDWELTTLFGKKGAIYYLVRTVTREQYLIEADSRENEGKEV